MGMSTLAPPARTNWRTFSRPPSSIAVRRNSNSWYFSDCWSSTCATCSIDTTICTEFEGFPSLKNLFPPGFLVTAASLLTSLKKFTSEGNFRVTANLYRRHLRRRQYTPQKLRTSVCGMFVAVKIWTNLAAFQKKRE